MKLKDQYWLRSGVLNIVQNFSGVFFGFGSFYLLVRVLDKHSFGAWTLFMSTVTIFQVIRAGLVQTALVKFLTAADPREHRKIVTAAAVILGALTGLCMIIASATAPLLSRLWLTRELMPMLWIYNIAFLLSGLSTLFHSIEQAHLKFRGALTSSAAGMAVLFTYLLVCFILGLKPSLVSLVWITCAGTLLGALIAFYSIREHLQFTRSVSVKWIRKLLGYGKYAFGTSISSILSGTLDQWMLGSILSPAASGAFNIAIRITNLIDIPTNAMATIVFPQSARRMETEGKEAVKYLYEKSVGVILAILFPVLLGLYLLTDLVVYIIAGEKYANAVPLLHITLLYCILIPFGRQFGTVISSMGKPKTSFYIVVTMMTVNLLLNYVFISEIGLMGAAYATLISNLIGIIIVQRVLSKELNVSLINTFIYAFQFYPEFYQKYVIPLKGKLTNRSTT